MADTLAMPTNEAIERVITVLRERLESAFANGQRVKVDARDGASTPRIQTGEFERRSLVDLVTTCESDGSFEMHVYIEPKRRR